MIALSFFSLGFCMMCTTWIFTFKIIIIKKNYSLARPTVATPHKFCTGFWQVSDKFDGCWFPKSQSHRPKIGKSQEGRRTFLSCDLSNLSKTCMKLMRGGHGWACQTVTAFLLLVEYFLSTVLSAVLKFILLFLKRISSSVSAVVCSIV